MDDRRGEERHGHMAIADVEVGRPSPVPSEGLIGVEKRRNVPSFGRVTGERLGCIVVSRGQEGLASPGVGMLPQSLNARQAGMRVSVGELAGPLGSGTASPTPHAACRRDEGELLAHSGWHRHGNQPVKRRVLVDLREECLGAGLCVGQDQHAGLIRLKHGPGQREQCRGGR